MKESQLENKTSIATNDYVRMVDENGNSVKIKKDSFMAAIRDALPSIISDGETGGGSVLSIINGALKTRTDANLASVLGAPIKVTRGKGKALKVTFKGDNRSCIFESFWTGGPTITGRAIIFIEDDKVYFLGGDYGRVSYQFYNNELYLGSVGSSPGYFMVSSSEYQKVTFTEVDPPTGGTWLSSEKIQSAQIS